MRWGIPDLKNPAPDISVVFGVEDRSRVEGSFDVVREKTRPSLTIEVVSPISESRKKKDYRELVRVYQRAGVDEYLIVKPLQPTSPGPVKLTLYRRNRFGRYQQIGPNAAGRIFSQTTNLHFMVDPDCEYPGVLVFDAQTGTRLLTSNEEEAERMAQTKLAEAAAERAAAEGQRAAAEAQRAATEAQRAAAEAQRAEAEAQRAAAEGQRAATEATARKAAEDRASVLAERVEAEAAARKAEVAAREAEAAARKAVEEELARLKEKLGYPQAAGE